MKDFLFFFAGQRAITFFITSRQHLFRSAPLATSSLSLFPLLFLLLLSPHTCCSHPPQSSPRLFPDPLRPPPSLFPTHENLERKKTKQPILGLLSLWLLLAAALSVAALALGSSKGITTYGGRTVSISVAGTDLGTLGEGTPPVAVGYAKYGDPADRSSLLPLGELGRQVRALGVAFAALLGCGAAAALALLLVTLLRGTGGLPAALLGFPLGLALLGVTVALYAAATSRLAGGSAPVQRSVGDLFKATVDAIRAPGAAFGLALGAALAWLAAAITGVGLPPRSRFGGGGGDLGAL